MQQSRKVKNLNLSDDLSQFIVEKQDVQCQAVDGAFMSKGDGCGAMAANTWSVGYNCFAGGHGIRMLSGELSSGRIWVGPNEPSVQNWALSDYQELLDEFILSGGMVSFRLEGCYTNASKIKGIDYQSNCITLCSIPASVSVEKTYTLSDSMFYVRESSAIPSKDSIKYCMWFPGKGAKFAMIGDVAMGINSFAEGWDCVTYADGSHAEGYGAQTFNRWGHAEGYGTKAGYASHAEGYGTDATGQYAHAEGWGTTATDYFSIASGIKANAKDRYSFVWNGMYKDNPASYYDVSSLNSHGWGTFNIGPKNGISGFYIGNESLAKILDDRIGNLGAVLDQILE